MTLISDAIERYRVTLYAEVDRVVDEVVPDVIDSILVQLDARLSEIVLEFDEEVLGNFVDVGVFTKLVEERVHECRCGVTLKFAYASPPDGFHTLVYRLVAPVTYHYHPALVK